MMQNVDMIPIEIMSAEATMMDNLLDMLDFFGMVLLLIISGHKPPCFIYRHQFRAS